METYVCEACGRTIPLCNMAIHSARCSGGPTDDSLRQRLPIDSHQGDSAEPAQGTPSTGLALPSTWSCSLCTYVNSSVNARCDMCGAYKDGTTGPSETAQMHRTSRIDSCGSMEWECEACTYKNPPAADECAMCSLARPPRSSYRETLVAEPDSYAVYPGPTTDVQPVARRRLRSVDDMAGSMLFGAGLGAGIAMLNDANVTNGALAGAGIGAIGNLLLREFLEGPDGHQGAPSPLVAGLRGNPLFAEHAIMDIMNEMMTRQTVGRRRHRTQGSGQNGEERWVDVDRMPFEELLERFPQPERGVDERTLDSLPEHSYVPTTTNSCNGGGASEESASGPRPACSICLEEYREGEQIKMLPCLHRFHSSCVANWLRQQRTCPVCKYEIEG